MFTTEGEKDLREKKGFLILEASFVYQQAFFSLSFFLSNWLPFSFSNLFVRPVRLLLSGLCIHFLVSLMQTWFFFFMLSASLGFDCFTILLRSACLVHIFGSAFASKLNVKRYLYLLFARFACHYLQDGQCL